MRTTLLDRTLVIVGVILMILTSIIFGIYAKADIWYIKAILYILIPLIFIIWWLWLQIFDDIIKGIKKSRNLKEKEKAENDTYQRHLSKTDAGLEYISRHRLAKYNVIQEKKELSLDELTRDIDQTKASIEQFTKQLNELNELKEKYIWKEWNEKFLKSPDKSDKEEEK